MKVLHLIYGFHRAGAESLACELAIRLKERGRVRPLVAALHDFGQPPELDLRAGLQRRGIPCAVLSGRPHWSSTPLALGRLLALCWRERPAVIHSHCEVPDLLGRVAAALSGATHVSTAHNVTLWPWRPKLGMALERLLFHRTRRFVAVSRAVARALTEQLRVPPERIQVLPNRVDPARLAAARPADLGQFGLEPGHRVLLTVARADRQKGPDVLAQALQLLQGEFPDVRALWVGEGPLRAGPGASRPGAGPPLLQFVGPRADVPSLLQAAEIFVLPSRWEGLPLALLEAQAAGRPVVATAVGGVPEVLEDGRTGRLVPGEDPAALAGALRDLLRQPESAAEMGRQARQRALESPPEDLAARHEEIYADCPPLRPDRLSKGIRRALLALFDRLKPLRVPLLPVALDVEPVNTCNFRCAHCQVTHWDKPRAQLAPEAFESLLEQFPDLDRVKLQGMGEPLLNRRLPELLRRAEARGLKVSFITNGSVLTPATAAELVGLERTRITVSLDGATSETFEKMRAGGDFQRVCDNLRLLTQARGSAGRPEIGIWTVVTRVNLAELSDLVRLSAELGADEVTLQVFVSDWGKAAVRPHAEALRVGERDPELEDALRRAQAAGLECSIRVTVYRGNLLSRHKKCSWPWTSAFVAANGDVVPCCVVADADTVRMGNLFEQPFEQIWNSPQYQELRRRIRDHELPDFCRNCYRDP